MALGDVIARLAVSLTMETAAFEQGATAAEKRMAQSEKRFVAMGSKLTGIGKTMSLAVTAPIVAFGIASVKAAEESEQALGQVNAALKSMGDGAGRTSEQLQGLATGLMRQSLYDDDEILRKVTANLLTFGNVAGDNFDRAQAAAVDLAARMGTDLQSATLMVGKALNDPAKGLAALRRVGIQFTDQQQEQIKTMAAAGNAAGAQAIMLSELERQFGGSAKAMRDANPAAALKNSFDDLQETIGAKLLPILPRIADAIGGLLDKFGQLSPGMQTGIIVAAGLAAALGPVLAGIGGLIQIMAPIIAGFSTLFGVIGAAAAEATTVGGMFAAWGAGLGAAAATIAPFVAAAAALVAVGYAIYSNWDKIAPVLQEFWEAVQTTLGPPLAALVDAVKGVFLELWNGPLGSMIKTVIGGLIEFQLAYAEVFGPLLLDALKLVIEVVTNVFRTIGDGVRLVGALLTGDWKAAFEAAGNIVNRIFGGLPAIVGQWMAQMVGAVRTWVVDKLNAVWNIVSDKIKEVGGWFKWLWDVTVGHSYIPDMVDAIGANMARLDALMVQPAKKAAQKVADTMKQLADKVKPLMESLFPEARDAVDFRAQRDALYAGIDKGGVAGYTPDQLYEAVFRLSRKFTGSTGDVPVNVDDNGPLDVTKGLDDLMAKFDLFKDKGKATTVAVAKSFKDMADATLQALGNLANAIKGGGFLDILSSVVGLGLQLGSIGAFGQSIASRINAPKIGSNARGTNSWRGGLTWVGERGAELIDLPGGSRVFSHAESKQIASGQRAGDSYHFQGNLMTPEFWAMIQNGDERAARTGAGLAQVQLANSRRWALS